MRVLWFGNVCNFAYWTARWGRELGYDWECLIEADNAFPRDRPDWEDPTYDPDAPPDWVRFYRYGSAAERARRGYSDPALPDLLAGYDVVVSFSPAAAIQMVAAPRQRHVHHTVGSFATLTSWPWGANLNTRQRFGVRRLITVLRFRRAVRDAARVLVGTANDYGDVAQSAFAGKIDVMPLAYDARLGSAYAEARRAAGPRADGLLTLMLPARQHWHLKGNDTFLRGIAALTEQERSRLDVEIGDWGVDAARTRALVSELGLDVRFHPLLKKDEMWEAFARPGVVVLDQVPHDDFHGGGLGGVARDALSAGAPVVTHASPEGQRRVFGTAPPVIHVEQSVSSVRDGLRRLLALSPEDLEATGRAGCEWMLREGDYRVVLPRYAALLDRLFP